MRVYSSARIAKSSRLRAIPEELLKVVAGGGAPKGNPKGNSGLGVPPGRPFTAATAACAAAAARAASCPLRSSEVSNSGG